MPVGPNVYQTPPYVNGGSSSSGGWSQWLPWLAGTAASLGSTALQARAQGQQNQVINQRTTMMDQLAQQENARRAYYSNILLPNILRGMGQKDPGLWRMATAGMKSLPGYGGAPSSSSTGNIGGDLSDTSGESASPVSLANYMPAGGDASFGPRSLYSDAPYDPTVPEDIRNRGPI